MTSKDKFSEICKWCLEKTYMNHDEEKTWGNKLNNTVDNSQWTTLLGEHFVKNLLKRMNFSVTKPMKKNGYLPDWETEQGIFEVKTRNWNTPGTVGEKVLGVPYKYSDIPRLYGKPLFIVCVAYQEYEFTYGNTQIFGKVLSKEKKNMIDYWQKMNIYYVPCSLLISMIDRNVKYDK